jgi:RNA-directed DNA polymerase
MKRFNFLFEQVCQFDNLLRAWKKAHQGTGWNQDTHHFNFHLEQQLFYLQTALMNETYQPGKYRYFSIRDPKPRTIAVAPFVDRVVHHALVQVLMPIFENTFIVDSYATRENKGTHKAIEKAQQWVRQYDWYYKMDVLHFFETVNHAVMLNLVSKKIKDKRLLSLTTRIIHNVPSDQGLPIGNLTSQFFANVYLNPLDHFIKENLGVKAYLRYMDDMVVFSNDKQILIEQHHEIKHYLSEKLCLTLKPKASWLNRRSHGLSFLGMRIFRGMIRMCPKNRQRSLKKLKYKQRLLDKGLIDEQRFADSANSLCSHLRYFCPNMPMMV